MEQYKKKGVYLLPAVTAVLSQALTANNELLYSGDSDTVKTLKHQDIIILSSTFEAYKL